MNEHSLNIQMAIRAYNYRRDKKEPKMTMTLLAELVFEDLSVSAGVSKLSALNQGQHERVGKITVKNIRDIAKYLGCSEQFLFNIPKDHKQ